MEFKYNDGGRSKYFKGKTGDCVTRAIAIATNKDYKEVYDEVWKLTKHSPRDGTKKKETKMLMEHFGFKWRSCMSIGTGCKVHLRKEELPKGTIVVRLTGHLCCVKDGVINDTFDCSRNETRCVYGYWY